MRKWAAGLEKFREAEWLYAYPLMDWGNLPPDNGLDLWDWIQEKGVTAPQLLDSVGQVPPGLRPPVTVKLSSPPKSPVGWDDRDADADDIQTEERYTEIAVWEIFRQTRTTRT